jgi:thioredoxin-related protein
MKGLFLNMKMLAGLITVLVILGAFTNPQPKQTKSKEESKIQWVALDDLQELNKKEPRKVFIDIYATWCGPCKLMDKKTFADPTIVEYVNDHYYAVKLNGEGKKQVSIFGKTMTEAELAYSFQIRGYPSIVFMDEAMQPYEPVAGYIPAQNFIKMLKQFNEDS